MTSQFEQFLTLKTLQAKYVSGYNSLESLQKLIDAGAIFQYDGTPITEIEQALPGQIQNLCAKVPTALIDHVTNICARLEITKREFIEAAIFEACDRASALMEKLDIDEFYREESTGVLFEVKA